MSSNVYDAGNALINPYYAIDFADHLFENYEIYGAKEDWVLKNTEMIKEMGAHDWLNQVLVSLGTAHLDNPTFTIICPARAVQLSERLKGKHEPVVEPETWITANEKLMDTLGTEAWLWQLLSVLETGGEVA